MLLRSATRLRSRRYRAGQLQRFADLRGGVARDGQGLSLGGQGFGVRDGAGGHHQAVLPSAARDVYQLDRGHHHLQRPRDPSSRRGCRRGTRSDVLPLPRCDARACRVGRLSLLARRQEIRRTELPPSSELAPPFESQICATSYPFPNPSAFYVALDPPMWTFQPAHVLNERMNTMPAPASVPHYPSFPDAAQAYAFPAQAYPPAEQDSYPSHFSS
ncbi:hypothetical protein AAT19DRAFT_15733 [Rhodotorula toruloides]|uniref:Uncharacterized protein n=1 Tax=Rhodotorula toruloides TaxID=5286 RepID=A0A2T0A4S6_RHOTO|nr:hypothetical protein AAT19DRAFT_15733 [Rhodotorula toruloides]